MPDTEQSVFLVDGHADPVIIKINGRANYTNCGPVATFCHHVAQSGVRHIIIDFETCKGMDSTFLGVLAGAALDFRRLKPPGTLTLQRLDPHNRELVCNLGLNRVLTIRDESQLESLESLESVPEAQADRQTIIKAHESLVEADAENEARFQDVLTFLRQQADEDN